MSRIGKLPINIPTGVDFKVSDKNLVTVKGPKGTLHQQIETTAIKVEISDNVVNVNRLSEQKRHKSLHGLYRQLIFNMVKGVSEGFKLQMELYGVGYKAENRGQILQLSLGYSHPVMFYIPEDVILLTETKKGEAPSITLESHDKQLLGQVAAKIRSFRKPEPYKGKGVRFKGEAIRRKAGKTASK
jgi:large subunit ribosomal protein L6